MENFWSIIWIVVWSFLFIAYLMIFFRIITDLFSDHEVSGVVKAIWIIALIFVPFLSALIYLVGRGQGMAERQLASARRAQGPAGAEDTNMTVVPVQQSLGETLVASVVFRPITG